MGSSSSVTRTPSTNGSRMRGLSSISCLSLSSSPLPSYGNSFGSFGSGYSTAPTSAAGTPALNTPGFDMSKGGYFGIRTLSPEPGELGMQSPTSIPLPNSIAVGARSRSNTAGSSKLAMGAVLSRKKRENFDFWKLMPDEIKIEIFKYLKPKEKVRFSAVSKAWQKMCFDGQLWTKMDASDFYRDIPAHQLTKLITNAGPFVKDLNLRGCVQLRNDWKVEQMSKACRNLVNASLEDCHLERSSIHSLVEQNIRLVHLSVKGLSEINNSTCRIIAESCPQLEVLNVSWCHNVDARGISQVVEMCPKLRDLRIGEVRGFDETEAMEAIFNANTLERLVLSGCDALTDNTLAVLCEGIDVEKDTLSGRTTAPKRKLKHLDLSRCKRLTDIGIKSLAENVPDLEGLQLSNCVNITDAGLSDLIASVPKLTHLDLEDLAELTNVTLQNLGRAPCKNTLRHLSISYCENLGDTGMLPVVKNCTELTNLELDNTRISDLVLAEAAHVVRHRVEKVKKEDRDGKAINLPAIGLRMVVYDCSNVTWTGVREVMSRNAEIKPLSQRCPAPTYPAEIIQLKCFYGWQMTVDEHMKRVLKGDLAAASRLERKWADYLMANEEAGAGGAGGRRRRRRAREAAAMHADEEEGIGGVATPRRRRARTVGTGCLIM
jgi:F-box and leucine-rich repeat protein 2/20